jgi:putative transposase
LVTGVGHPDDVGDARAGQHVWMKRFYDFNVWSQRQEVEKIKYMHRNPVVRGLVERPED